MLSSFLIYYSAKFSVFPHVIICVGIPTGTIRDYSTFVVDYNFKVTLSDMFLLRVLSARTVTFLTRILFC